MVYINTAHIKIAIENINLRLDQRFTDIIAGVVIQNMHNYGDHDHLLAGDAINGTIA